MNVTLQEAYSMACRKTFEQSVQIDMLTQALAEAQKKLDELTKPAENSTSA